jgi:arginyl-tRNA--protein-N-Asp/Glu arginylyltransferase
MAHDLKIEVEVKQCTNCKGWKPITEFSPSRIKRRTGEIVYRECKACVSARVASIKYRSLSTAELLKLIARDERNLALKRKILQERED